MFVYTAAELETDSEEPVVVVELTVVDPRPSIVKNGLPYNPNRIELDVDAGAT